MLWVNIKRVFRTGFVNFWRNSFVSLSSILVMIITLFVIGSVMFMTTLLTSSLDEIKNKVDINVYFHLDTAEADILGVKSSLETLPSVASVDYVSKEQALENFKKRHENDQLTLQALEELDENPLGGVLNVRAIDPSQYENIAQFLEGEEGLSEAGVPIIEKINYAQNKVAIDKLSRMIESGRLLGLIITLVLVTMSILITFNTIRLTIYVSREEISVMRLVGASNKYIRGPFVVVGIMYGVMAAMITLVLFYPVTYWLGSATQDFFAGINVFSYYVSNFPQIFLIIMGSGIAIGAISSYLAVKKYLNV